jgi:hypothetical protein
MAGMSYLRKKKQMKCRVVSTTLSVYLAQVLILTKSTLLPFSGSNLQQDTAAASFAQSLLHHFKNIALASIKKLFPRGFISTRRLCDSACDACRSVWCMCDDCQKLRFNLTTLARI